MNYIYKQEIRDGHDYVDMSTVMDYEKFERLKAVLIDIWNHLKTLVAEISENIHDRINKMGAYYSIEEIEKMKGDN